ncbi:MAG: NusG domain II-containing protein [Clostridia bacterium]|nr:NusG domain II-containing protein [Clostridia bacterium]
MKKLLTRTDLWILCGALLLLALALFFFRAPGRNWANTVNIYVDGALYASVPLGEARDIAVAHDGHVNIVAVDAQGVWMREADCPNGECVAQGKVTPDNMRTRPLGNRILCLPNRVTVELTAK